MPSNREMGQRLLDEVMQVVEVGGPELTAAEKLAAAVAYLLLAVLDQPTVPAGVLSRLGLAVDGLAQQLATGPPR